MVLRELRDRPQVEVLDEEEDEEEGLEFRSFWGVARSQRNCDARRVSSGEIHKTSRHVTSFRTRRWSLRSVLWFSVCSASIVLDCLRRSLLRRSLLL